MYKIKFGTDGWRAIIAKDYTIENLHRVSKATADWLNKNYESPVVVIGYDCRFGGKMFAENSAAVLADQGIKVLMGHKFVSTPMISLGVVKLKGSMGVVITASHNPPSYNGFKLKADFGGPSSPETISEVESLIPDEVYTPEKSYAKHLEEGKIEVVDLEGIYLKEVEEKFDLDAIKNSGIGVAYDAMYGAGMDVLKRILPDAHLLHADFNPSFKGQAPEPLHKNLQELSSLIKENDNIHFGMATDGDADRIGLYNASGEFVDSHKTLLLLTHYQHKFKGLTGKVATTFSVTNKLRQLCNAYDLPIEITKIGFKYLCGIMVNENVIVGGEESGGIAISGHVPERDGIWIALTVLEFMAKTGKSLDDLMQEIYAVVGEFEFKRNDLHVENDLKWAIMDNCKAGKYTQFGSLQVERVEEIDGFKFFFSDDEWVMIRPSGTEPVLRVYCEAQDMNRVDEILGEVEKAITS